MANAARCVRKTKSIQASLPGDNRALEPPDPIPNSEVKRRIADGSVGLPHVRVGHRQALIRNPVTRLSGGIFLWAQGIDYRGADPLSGGSRNAEPPALYGGAASRRTAPCESRSLPGT